MIPIKIKRLHPDAVIPKYANKYAACFDLTVTSIEFPGDGKAILKFGLAVEIPEGYKLVLLPRSSFTLKGWVQANSPGQIDCDYRGELQMRIEQMAPSFFPFKEGDRAAQAFVEKVLQAEFEEVEELAPSDRGVNGWGSTGK